MAAEQRESLRAEILAMGGNEEDLKLVEDAGSDSELEGEDEAVVAAKPSRKGKEVSGPRESPVKRDEG